MNRSLCALQRLAAIAAIALLVCLFACRPAWSPDGKRLLFTAVDDGGRFVACYDRETGKVERVFVPPDGHDSLHAMWSSDGKRAVVLSSVSRGKSGNVAVTEVSVTPLPVIAGELAAKAMSPQEAPRTRSIKKGTLERRALVAAVVVGRHFFYSTGNIVRVDLETGATKSLVAGVGERLAVTRRGNGLSYVSYTVGRKAGPNGVWEVGSLDPETLQRTMLLQSKDFPGVQVWPRPSFSPDLERIAMPSQDCESIILFREGKIESTLPLGAKLQVSVNDLVWSRHGDKIYATLSRAPEKHETGYQWSLYESTIGGSMQRETVLFGSPPRRFRGMLNESLGLEISPDGKTAAMTTGYASVALSDHGLYLVDLSHPKRTLTKVEFPQSQTVTMCGSDSMLSLAKLWSDQFRAEYPGHVVKVRGGGTGAGLARLLAGDTDLSMAMRSAKSQELDAAKQQGVTLEQHCVVRNAASICVHKDSPITSLTIAQLKQIFGAKGVTKWSELGIEMPLSDNDIIMATREQRSRSYRVLQASLARVPFAHSRITPENDDVLVAFAALKKGAIVVLDDSDAAARDPEVKLVPIAREDSSQPCMPTNAAIADGSYPLVVSMFVYSRKGADENVSRYLKWLRSDVARKLTTRFGFRPPK